MTLFLIVLIIALAIVFFKLPVNVIQEVEPEPIPDIELIKPKLKINDHIPLTGHTIVVGQAGSGKSNVLMSQIIRRIDANHEIHGIDIKRELAPLFYNHCEFVNLDRAKEKLEELIEIADERQKLFEETSKRLKKVVRDIGEYNKVSRTKLNFISLFVEELVVFSDEVPEELLVRLLVLGRSAGVFVIAASQYLTADILSRKGSVNFHNRCFLGRYDRIGTSILFGNLDKEDLENIKEFVGLPGNAALMLGSNLSYVKMPRITDTILEDYL